MSQDTNEKKNQEKTEKTPVRLMIFGQWNGEPYNREEIKGILWQEWY